MKGHLRKVRGQGCAFTLIEMMIVVAILGLLGAILIPQIMESPEDREGSTLRRLPSQTRATMKVATNVGKAEAEFSARPEIFNRLALSVKTLEDLKAQLADTNSGSYKFFASRGKLALAKDEVEKAIRETRNLQRVSSDGDGESAAEAVNTNLVYSR